MNYLNYRVFNYLHKLPGGFKNIFYFVLYSNFFIVICSLVMSYHTSGIFNIPLSFNTVLFIFSGTLASYSFHWMLPPAHTELSLRDKWSRSNRIILLILFLAGITGSAIALTGLKNDLLKLIPLIFLTFLYSSGRIPGGLFKFFRKYFIGKTIYLALMWTMVTVYLPIILSGTGWRVEHTVFFAGRFFFLFAICILFDLRDKEADTRLGIKSLITLLSYSKVKLLFYGSISASLVFYMLLIFYNISATDIVFLAAASLITALSYVKSIATKSDAWYYFYLDGLMMASGLLYILYKMPV